MFGHPFGRTLKTFGRPKLHQNGQQLSNIHSAVRNLNRMDRNVQMHIQRSEISTKWTEKFGHYFGRGSIHSAIQRKQNVYKMHCSHDGSTSSPGVRLAERSNGQFLSILYLAIGSHFLLSINTKKCRMMKVSLENLYLHLLRVLQSGFE